MNPAVVLLAFRVLLAVALYTFLAFVLLFLWRDFRSASVSGGMCPPAQLTVHEGPEAGRGFPLADVNSLGRAADNSIRLIDETVSAYHAQLSYRAGQWWLTDLGSRNGTHVNEIAVEQPLIVTYGDEIRLGRVRLHLRAGLSSALPVVEPLPPASEGDPEKDG